MKCGGYERGACGERPPGDGGGGVGSPRDVSTPLAPREPPRDRVGARLSPRDIPADRVDRPLTPHDAAPDRVALPLARLDTASDRVGLRAEPREPRAYAVGPPAPGAGAPSDAVG